jgi:hypothetical protein
MFNSIGTDLELFAKDKNGIHRSVCEIINGTKEQPLQIEGLPDGYMVQHDNVAVEFNIPPCYNKQEFLHSITMMKREIFHILRPFGLQIDNSCAVSFPQSELTHPDAVVFGCEPDYNAWTMSENPKPKTTNANLRTCGGHIHVGTSLDMVKATQLMDLCLGIPAIILDNSPGADARRLLYGKAGAMRPKPYGFEYRVLSNFWLFEDYLINWVFETTNFVCSNHKYLKITDTQAKKIQNAINSSNIEQAQIIIRDFGLSMPLPQKQINF